jgi:hypothetical protein
MKRILFFLLCVLLYGALSAQRTYTIKADTVILTGCDSSELIIKNHTQGVHGFLYNTDSGRTIFKRGAQSIGGGAYIIGADTIRTSANAWLQGGNSFGTIGILGNLDSNDLDLYTNGSKRAWITGHGVFNTASDALINGMTVGTGFGNDQTNTVVGFNALQSRSILGRSTVIGYAAGQHATGNILAIGYTAAANATGNGLIAIGTGSGANVGPGGFDIAIGSGTLNADSVSGWHNIAIGNTTAQQVTTGQYNTMIGAITAKGLISGSFNTILGAQITVPPDMTNTIVLADGQGNQRLYLNGNGYTGINTTAPIGALQVNEQVVGPATAFVTTAGSTAVTGVGTQFLSTFLPGDSIVIQGETQVIASVNSNTSLTTVNPWITFHAGSAYSTTGAPRMLIQGNGYTGVGTTSPASQLDISGRAGYHQFRMRTAYTPSSSSDSNGNVGDFSWDTNYLYIKTSSGWKRSALTTF